MKFYWSSKLHAETVTLSSSNGCISTCYPFEKSSPSTLTEIHVKTNYNVRVKMYDEIAEHYCWILSNILDFLALYVLLAQCLKKRISIVLSVFNPLRTGLL